MYTAYFGLREHPFRLAVNPRFLYATPDFQATAESILNSLHRRKSLILLTGEVGTGKTTLLHKLRDDLSDTYAVAFVDHTILSFAEIVTAVCDIFHLPVHHRESEEELLQMLTTFCLKQQQAGKGVVLLLDEGQNLQESALEKLPLLLLPDSQAQPRLQLILAGQPELEEKLRAPRWQRLRDSISQSYRLDCLSEGEVGPFIRHRLHAAGGKQDLFSPQAIERIAYYSQGIPRLINVICDNALRIAYLRSPRTISAEVIETTVEEVRLRPALPPGSQVERDALALSDKQQELRTEPTPLALPFHIHKQFWLGAMSGALLAGLIGGLLYFPQSLLPHDQAPPEAENESQIRNALSSSEYSVASEQTLSPQDALSLFPSPLPSVQESPSVEQATSSAILQPSETSASPKPILPVSVARTETSQPQNPKGDRFPPLQSSGFKTDRSTPQKSLVPGKRAFSVAQVEGKPRNQKGRHDLSEKEKELFRAVANGDSQMAARLLDAGVSPNATSGAGWTPLMWAAIDGRFAIAQRLLSSHALVDAKNNHGMTPLMYAAWNGHSALLRLLLEHGAQVHIRDSNGATALDYAENYWARFTRREERPVIVKLLTQVSAKK